MPAKVWLGKSLAPGLPQAVLPPQLTFTVQRRHYPALGIGVEIPRFVQMQTPLRDTHGQRTEVRRFK